MRCASASVCDAGVCEAGRQLPSASTCSASRLLLVDRYLAPEVLDRSMDENNFEAFKANDMYAYGLVLWELLRCTRSVDGAHSLISTRSLLFS